MKYFLFTQKTLLLNIKYSNGEDNRHIDYNSVRDLAWGGRGRWKTDTSFNFFFNISNKFILLN